MTPHDTFRAKAPGAMRRLIAEFSLSVMDAAAILGNLGHESEGMADLTEDHPLVKGSTGGYGWGQWTGPRRRLFVDWCATNKLAPTSDAANLGYLIHELHTTEAGAIPSLKKAVTLADKVIAFEAHFERAGIKHYDSREAWADLALSAYSGSVAQPSAQTQTRPPGYDPSQNQAGASGGPLNASPKAGG